MTTNWNIAEMRRIPSNGLVFEVTYIMNFDLQGEQDRQVGSITLSGDPSSPDFVPYEDLTPEIVLNWIQTSLGQEEIERIELEFETRLQEKLDRKNNPPYLTGIPWE